MNAMIHRLPASSPLAVHSTAPATLNFRAPVCSRVFCMVRFLRTALLWLSLLALPLHGMAGTLGMLCMADGHDMPASSMHAEQRGGADTVPAGSMTASAEDGASNGDAVELCDAGSVCFASVALPVFPLDVIGAAPVIAPQALVADTRISFFTSGPDRPPRPAFA